jgi:hypothetical protein
MTELSELLSDAKDPIVTAHERGCSDSTCDVGGGRMHLTLLQALGETTLALEMGRAAGGITNGTSQIWLPFLDTYRTMCLAPQPEFRRLLEQARDLPIAA